MKGSLLSALFFLGLGMPVSVCAMTSAQVWIDALQSDDESAAQSAEAELVKMGSDAVRPLQRVLEDSNFKLRRRAAETLGQLGPQARRAAPDLVVLLSDPQFEVQAAAQKALGQMGDEAIPALAQALRSDHEGDRKVALETLSGLGPKATPYLLNILKKDDNPILRSTAADALGRVQPPTPEITEALIQGLSNLDEGVRGSVVDALGQGGAASIPAIRALFGMSRDDKDSFVRHKAGEVLLQVGISTPTAGALVASAYQPLLKDENTIVRRQAIDALSRLGIAGLPGLIQALEDRDPALVNEAAQAIVQMGPAAIPSLEALKQSPYPYLVRVSTSLLGQIQGAPAAKPKSRRKRHSS